MTPKQIELVKDTYAIVAIDSENVAKLFYSRLFATDPGLRTLFPDDLTDQRRKLMATLKLAVNSLDNIGGLLPVLRDLGRRHESYGVHVRDYDRVGAALLHTLQLGLGPRFTTDVKLAWIEAYSLLSGAMIEGTARRKRA